jgi:hypothetical protein
LKAKIESPRKRKSRVRKEKEDPSLRRQNKERKEVEKLSDLI